MDYLELYQFFPFMCTSHRFLKSILSNRWKWPLSWRCWPSRAKTLDENPLKKWCKRTAPLGLKDTPKSSRKDLCVWEGLSIFYNKIRTADTHIFLFYVSCLVPVFGSHQCVNGGMGLSSALGLKHNTRIHHLPWKSSKSIARNKKKMVLQNAYYMSPLRHHRTHFSPGNSDPAEVGVSSPEEPHPAWLTKWNALDLYSFCTLHEYTKASRSAVYQEEPSNVSYLIFSEHSNISMWKWIVVRDTWRKKTERMEMCSWEQSSQTNSAVSGGTKEWKKVRGGGGGQYLKEQSMLVRGEHQESV